MTTIRLAKSIGLAVICALLTAQTPAASAQELSAKDLKKILRQAGKATESGRVAEAVGLYRQALEALPEDDPRRADALYFTAMSDLAGDTDAAGKLAARMRLEELATAFPSFGRSLEVGLTRALLGEVDTVHAEIARRDAELQAKTAAIATAQQEAEAAEQESAGESKAADNRVKSLEAQLRNMRGELKETRAELEKKEEALQKLKDALVGRAGASGQPG